MVNNNDLVSVVVACYNHARYVEESIISIINQDYTNIELIIIDDGSSDNSVEAIEKLVSACKERFVRFEFRHRPNRGLCATLNEAIEWCAGYYLSPFASDDIMHPMRISKQVAVFQEMAAIRENLVAVYSGVEFIDSEGITISKRRGSGKFSGFKEVAFRSEFLPSPTFLVIKESILAVGGYNSEYKVEDLYIRLKLTNAGGCFYTIPDVFVKYRRHDDNLSKKSDLIWMEVKKIISEYKHEDIYTGALAFSMMVQAHDSQINSNTEGVKFALKAARTNFRVIFSKSMLKFIVKLFYKPKS